MKIYHMNHPTNTATTTLHKVVSVVIAEQNLHHSAELFVASKQLCFLLFDEKQKHQKIVAHYF
jgi:hypothetical protein